MLHCYPTRLLLQLAGCVCLGVLAGGCNTGWTTSAKTAPPPSPTDTAAPVTVIAKDPHYPPSQWFPGIHTPPQVKVKLPDNFTLVSAGPDDAITYDGWIWAPPPTANRYAHMKERNLRLTTEPLFYVRLSSEVGQIPGTDTFNVEKNIDQMIATFGLKNAEKRKTHWGRYPVLAVTGQRPDQTTFFMAWVGMNTPDGWTLFIDYRVPIGAGHPTPEELSIWKHLIEDTTEGG